jgi:hypothetical protein
MTALRLLLPLLKPLMFLLGLFGVRWDAARDQRTKAALDAAKQDAKRRERMDDADAMLSDDPAVLRDFLRSRDPGTR